MLHPLPADTTDDFINRFDLDLTDRWDLDLEDGEHGTISLGVGELHQILDCAFILASNIDGEDISNAWCGIISTFMITHHQHTPAQGKHTTLSVYFFAEILGANQ